jgi:hypothetical protein
MLGRCTSYPLWTLCSIHRYRTVYSNSLLATLNARRSIRGLSTDSDGFSLSSPSFASPSHKNSPSKKQTLSVRVDTIHESIADPTYHSPTRRNGQTIRFADQGAAKTGYIVSDHGHVDVVELGLYPVVEDGGIEIEVDDTEVELPRHSGESSPTLAASAREIGDVEAQHVSPLPSMFICRPPDLTRSLPLVSSPPSFDR